MPDAKTMGCWGKDETELRPMVRRAEELAFAAHVAAEDAGFSHPQGQGRHAQRVRQNAETARDGEPDHKVYERRPE